MAIITPTEFKAYRGISVATWDTLIGILIDGAQAYAERWCGRDFESSTATEYLDGNDGEILQLASYPITSITSVDLLAADLLSTLETYTAGTDYIFRAETGQLIRTGVGYGRTGPDADGFYTDSRWGNVPSWPWGRKNIKVIYVGGNATMPADLKLAMYKYVDWLYGQSYATGGQSTAITSERLGEYAREIGGGDSGANSAIGRASPSLEQMKQWFGMFKRGDCL